MSLEEALRIAEGDGLDLVEIAPEGKPPVCRLMDYNKYKYEQDKKIKKARKKQHITHIKGIRLRPKIGEHDYQVKVHKAERFLKANNKVKVTLIFRGREREHVNLGRQLLERFAQDLTKVSIVENSPKFEYRNMVMVLAAKDN